MARSGKAAAGRVYTIGTPEMRGSVGAALVVCQRNFDGQLSLGPPASRIRSEKLAELGLRPFRGRNRTAKATAEQKPQSQTAAPPATPSHAEPQDKPAE